MSCAHYSRRHFSQFSFEDFIRLDISIDKPVDDISDVSANLTRYINGVKSANRIPYYGISFKDQRFFVLLGTLSKDDEIDWKWARSFFRNYTARLPISNKLNNRKLFFNHQKILPLFYKEYPNHHITFRINTISFTTRKVDLSSLNLSLLNTTSNQRKAKKNADSDVLYYLSRINISPFNLPCFAQGILGEGDDIKMKIAGIEYNSSQYSIEVRLYLVIIGFCLLLSFYAWNSLKNFASTQAHISTISFFSLLLICAYDISICLDFSSTSNMNDCFTPPSRLYLFIFLSQMALYVSMQFPIVYHIFKQQEIMQQQSILETLFEVASFFMICFFTHQLHIKSSMTYLNGSFDSRSKIKSSPFSLNNNDVFSQKSKILSILQNFHKKTFFSFIISCSQFTPQIIKNLMLSQRRGINMKFIFLIGISRLLLFLYTDVYPFNVYETEIVNKNFNHYLDISIEKYNLLPSLFILFQIFFLFFQQRFGPYFFIPKLFSPKTYNYRALKPREGEVCLICQDTINPDEEQTAITPCGHAFHLQCLARWMEEKQQCPICRNPIPPINFDDYAVRSNQSSSQNLNRNQSSIEGFADVVNIPFDGNNNNNADLNNNNSIDNMVDDSASSLLKF
ncbi:hypothetical protein M9Y10_009667 [Tritrichomonas musculus]|uniref:RING-type E3 ubiquitin transferase n=1 Tax=Tritrichomonas musculus TaxID=1915356 RepID=A0ABR2IQ60_9EUKA